MPIDQLLWFVAAGLLLNLTPGPDVLYIVCNALRGGARVGMVAALGIAAGCFVHIFAAAVGISALMAASATAFTILKWLGAAYLVYVGVRLLFTKADDAMKFEAHNVYSTRATDRIDYKTIFLRGFWTNALNPKVALFFLAFLPQFIAPTVEHKSLAFLLLGLVFNFNGLWVNMGWALVADRLTQYLRKAAPCAAAQRGGLFVWLDRVAGAMFVGFGIKLALTQTPNA